MVAVDPPAKKKKGKGGGKKPKQTVKPKGRVRARRQPSKHPLLVAELKGHGGIVTCIAASRMSPAVIVTGCEDRKVRAFKCFAERGGVKLDNNALKLPTGFTAPLKVAVNGDGGKVVALLVEDNAVASWAIPLPEALGTPAAGPARDLGIWKHNHTSGASALALASADAASSATMLVRPRPFVVTSDAPKTGVHFWGLKGKLISKHDTGQIRNRAIACSSDASYCAVASYLASVQLYKMVRSGGHGGDDLGASNVRVEKAGALTGFHKKGIIAVAFGCGARAVPYVATASDDGTWAVWEVDSRFGEAGVAAPRLVGSGSAPPGHVMTCVALSPDAKLFAAGTAAGALVFFRVADGAVVDTINDSHAGVAVRSVVCVPGVRCVASLGEGQTFATVWRWPAA